MIPVDALLPWGNCKVSRNATYHDTGTVRVQRPLSLNSNEQICHHSAFTSRLLSTRIVLFSRIDGHAGHSSSTQSVQQYSPAHNDAVTSITSLTSEQCVSGGKDKVRLLSSEREELERKSFSITILHHCAPML